MSVIVILLLVSVGLSVGGLAFVGNQQAQQRLDTASNFCADLRHQRYPTAYTLFSPTYQAQISLTQFVAASGFHDTLDGAVTACSLVGGTTAGFTLSIASTASLTLRITRKRIYTDMLTLIADRGGWTISAVSSTLHGIDVAPLVTATTFCDALVGQNYATAYGQLTLEAQSVETEPDFATSYQHAFDGAGASPRLSDCTYQVSTYHVSADDEIATLNITFEATQQLQIPATLTFAHVPRGWEIANIALISPAS